MLTTIKIRKFILILTLLLTVIVNHIFEETKIATFISYIGFLPLTLVEIKYKRFYKFLYPLIVAFFSGFIFLFNHVSSDIIRDLFYFLNPILFIIFGSLFALNFEFKDFIKILVHVGTLLSLIFIVKTFVILGLSFLNDFTKIRSLISVGNPLSIIALIILIFHRKYQKSSFIISPELYIPYIIINLSALIMFGSRTYFGLFIIGLIIFLYPMRKNFARLIIVISIITIGAVVIFNTYKDSPFIEKLSYSFSEVTNTNDVDMENLYLNYRGYENKNGY
ncbi:MAG: hypothetical protein QM751_06940 [Paludibacteraceae bacterium]